MSKVTEKAKGINLEGVDDDPLPGPPDVATRPRTALGIIATGIVMGRGLEAENKDLKEKLGRFEDAMLVEMIDPHLITPGPMANRHESSFSGKDFESLRSEIYEAGRNVQPIKVRPIPGGAVSGSPARYEIVYGHRRHRACLEMEIPVAAIVQTMDDKELFVEMERENRDRQDLSPWEQGTMYRRAVESGVFSSLRHLATELGVSRTNVSTAVLLASLPPAVVAAFQTPLALQFRWATPLNDALSKNPSAVIDRASEIAALHPRPPAATIFRELVEAALPPSERQALRTIEPALLMRNGKEVGSWKLDAKGGLSVQLKPGAITAAQQKKLETFIQGLLG